MEDKIFEKGITKLMSYVILFSESKLTNLEQIILKESLINKRSFREISVITKIEETRCRTIFVKAINNLCKILKQNKL